MSRADDDGYAHVDLVEGATFTLELDVTPRWTRGHHKVDAVRGCLALERGPVVYCIEQASLPEGAVVDDLVAHRRRRRRGRSAPSCTSP